MVDVKRGIFMDKLYFPMFVNLTQKKIVVIGGGTIATRRVQTLISFTDNLTVIAPEISYALKKYETEGIIHCEHRGYLTEDIEDADMVLAATNDTGLNHRIAEECKALELKRNREILINTADDKNLCDFYFPSVIEADGIIIGINSGGRNPMKVKQIRKKLEKTLSDLG
jgi:precorrin-2 dehydrogenase/sirohydrochlorin ferrochelatase